MKSPLPLLLSLLALNSLAAAGLPADVAAHLQAVAWETAQAFHAKEGRGGL